MSSWLHMMTRGAIGHAVATHSAASISGAPTPDQADITGEAVTLASATVTYSSDIMAPADVSSVLPALVSSSAATEPPAAPTRASSAPNVSPPPAANVDPDVEAAQLGADPASDASVFSLLRHILAGMRELGDVKPVQAAYSMYYMLNHPERSEALDEAAENDPLADLPHDSDVHCRVAVGIYATTPTKLHAVLAPKFAAEDVLYSQLQSSGLLPAHMLLLDREHQTIYLAIRGTSGISDAVKDLAGSSTDFCGSSAHVGMAAGANAFFSRRYSDTVAKAAQKTWWPTASPPVASSGSTTSATSATSASSATSGGGGDGALAPNVAPGSSSSSALQEGVATPTTSTAKPAAVAPHQVVGLPRVAETLWQLYPGFRILVVGHSLGAGIGVLVCCKLRATLHRIDMWRSGKISSNTSALPASDSTVPSSVSRSTDPAADPDSVASSAAKAPCGDIPAKGTSTALPSQAFTAALSLDDIAACRAPIQACLFATPACASPELAAICSLESTVAASLVVSEDPTHSKPTQVETLTATTSSARGHPIVRSVVIADDIVSRLSIYSVKKLHERLADPSLVAAAKSEAYSDTLKAGAAAASSLWNAVSGGPSGVIQSTGRSIYTGVASTVTGVLDSPTVTQASEVVTSQVVDMWKRFNRHATPAGMTHAYETLGPPDAETARLLLRPGVGEIAGVQPESATQLRLPPAGDGEDPSASPEGIASSSGPDRRLSAVSTASESADSTGETLPVLRATGGAGVGGGGASVGVGSGECGSIPVGPVSPPLRAACDRFKKELCEENQKLVVPGVIYHITRVHNAKSAAVTATDTGAVGGSGVQPAGVSVSKSVPPPGVSSPLHAAVVSNVAAADAVGVDRLVSSSAVVRSVEAHLSAREFRVHIIPPSRLSRVRISRTMLSDHRKKLYLATCEALLASPSTGESLPGIPMGDEPTVSADVVLM